MLADQVGQLRQLIKEAHVKQQRGFTLIEAVVVITIAGLMLAAALPSAGAWIRNSRIRTAAESISNGLMQARNEAVRRNQSVSFYLVSDADAVSMTDACALSATSSAWVISLSSPAGRCGTDLATFVAVRPVGDGANGLNLAAVDSTAAPATTVTFNGFGQIANASPITCVKVRNPSYADTRPLLIAVNPGGQVRMCDPAVTDANDPRKCLAGCDSAV
jgi:type IV fimbrial biogenesis protein FimT